MRPEILLRGAPAALRLLGRLLLHPPGTITLSDRLAQLPLRGAPVRAPVQVRWDAHAIPFIEAGSDADLAAALGVVHAHLRLAQMEGMRRLATGRVAEAIGPLGVPLDHTMRLFGFARVAAEIVATLPTATRDWAEPFLAGVNHVILHGPRPPELAVLDLPREPWTLTDLFACARLAAADVSWMVFARLLRARAALSPAEWKAAWPRLLGAGAPPAWPPEGALPGEAVLASVSRGGSNCCAVAASRSARGAALIASDPHLPLALPSTWLLAGMRSPGIRAVGLMLAGFPFVALGRNRHIAWGGTSLHAASSELHDATDLTVTERTELVRVRGRAPERVLIRDTALGPIVSDGVLLRSRRPVALRWVGQRPSDELGAMLAVMRARDLDGFRDALRGFAVPGQTMVCAGSDGRVGRVTAAHLPRRAPDLPADVVLPPGEAWPLDGLADMTELPARLDPPEGTVVSANERPDGEGPPVGWFFSSGRRAARMRGLLGGAAPVSAADLRQLQMDVMDPAALALRDLLLRLLAQRTRPRTPRRARALAALAAWDGGYGADSAGALAFEAVVARLAAAMHPARLRATDAAGWSARALFARDLAAVPPARLVRPAELALEAAARLLARHRVWGGAHRMRPAHHLAAIPVLGRRYAGPDFPGAGGNDTVLKTGHGPVRGRHIVRFGAGARHVSDLADPDANQFVLFGGQDGWPGSDTAADQVPLWRAGQYVRLPMRPDPERFPHLTVLRPA